MLQVLPVTASHVAIILTLHLFFTIGSPQGTSAFAMPPQEIAVIAAAVGSVACLGCCLLLPRLKRKLTSRRPAGVSAKRKNMLGLVSEHCKCC